MASVDFEKGIVWIKWVGSHKAYDRINAQEVEYEKP
ncbi:MAG: type II toxin-antitoxin system HigB family toxin [Deltaproteobacteria bacterium]|nr:type II toxin-antitoxin system HigB family toxin [Deltaproteobacteria bacterium]